MTISKEECQSNVHTMTEKIDKVATKVQSIEVNLAALPKKIIDEMDDRYVSKDMFTPIQKLVYGLAGAFLIGLVGIILNTITN